MEKLTSLLQAKGHQEWLIALVVFAATVLILRVVQWLVRRKLSKFAERTATRWDDYAVTAIGDTHFLFLVAIGIYVASLTLVLRPAYAVAFQSFAAITLLLQGGIWLNSILREAIEERRRLAENVEPARLATLALLGFVARVVLWSVVLLLLLDNLGIDVTALVAGLGIGGVAVALAVQNILGDLFASLSIVLDKPFVIGDFLVVDDFMGAVEKIGLKTTRIRSLSGEQLVLSNNDLLTSRVRNFGRMQERRVVFTLGVTYQTPREQIEAIPGLIRQAVEAADNTRFDRSHFSEYANFSLNFETVYYVLSRDFTEYMDAQQAIYLHIHEAFEKAGIEFAYPTQTLYLQEGKVPDMPGHGPG